MHWVVAADFVVGHALVFRGVLVLKEALSYLVLKRGEIYRRVFHLSGRWP